MAAADVLLALLQAGPTHGYDLKRRHDQWFPDTRPLAYGQVYSTLGRLQRDGLVEVVETRSDGAAARTVYALTATGAARLRVWLAEPEVPADRGAADLVTKTIAALHSAGGAGDFIAKQRATHLHKLTELFEAPAPVDPAAALAREFTRTHLEADLHWLHTAAAEGRWR